MATSITITSLGQVYKYGGLEGFIAFTLITLALVLIVDKKWNSIDALLSKGYVSPILILCIVSLLICLFIALFPSANAGEYGGGSDADDALKIGAEAILSLSNPYHLQTYLGLPITPGLGAILLSIPFYLLGNVSYQNFFWLLILILLIYKHFKNFNTTLILCVFVYVINPLSLVQIITGVDHLTNGIYVFIPLLIFITLFHKISQNKTLLFISAVMLGISISSRINFLFMIPILFAHIYHSSNYKQALKWTSVSTCTVLLLALPLYLNDPSSFTPVKNAAGRIGHNSEILQISTIFVTLIAVITTGIVCLKRYNQTKTSIFFNFALVQIISISTTVFTRASLSRNIEATDLITFDYGAFTIPFFAFVFITKISANDDVLEHQSLRKT